MANLCTNLGQEYTSVYKNPVTLIILFKNQFLVKKYIFRVSAITKNENLKTPQFYYFLNSEHPIVESELLNSIFVQK